ncbi:hypothetical protein GCM10010331_65780 [Streptomyces xanthochromogenes]|uniref:Uncharacterized protein n=1 Tax=Streptomyces xanthochromogenes TaxID=67384 RepID=A0ABQ3AKV3_9ACTN|nr:hypothetical protein GCM10010326_58530 [Streptomyces xanthochromogenes]GHB68590.1 hypothetical protein GCM10010331_65780 [Streptomyces xanthochromogenes]
MAPVVTPAPPIPPLPLRAEAPPNFTEGHRTWVPILRSQRYAWRFAAYSTTY